MSQIQVLGPRFRSQVQQNVLGPRKCARFRFQFRDLGTRSQKISQIQVLDLRFRSQVLENDLDLRPKARKWSQDQDLSPKKGPRFRPQVQDLGPRSGKISQIQVLGPRFRSQVQQNQSQVQAIVLGLGSSSEIRSQVLENVLDLGSRSQIQVLGPRKVLRFRPSVLKMFLDLVPRSQKGPRFRSQFLEKVRD